MRVLMVSKACITGIYQRKLEEIAQLGVELIVIVPPGWRDERGWMPVEQMYTKGYDLRVTPMAFNGSFHLHYYPLLRRILAETRPDIVHIDEEPYNLATWHILRLSRRFGARSLFFTWQNLYRRYPPPFSWCEQYVYKRVSFAIAGNHEAVQVLGAKGYGGPVHVIPQFGVDPSLYQPASYPGVEPFTIGYVGRLVSEKGIGDLLQAAAKLSGQWRIRLLGNGPEREALMALARSLSIADRVVLDAHIPASEVPAYLSRLHALVLPSHTRPNWKEQFGRVLIEAMASGVPAIGSDSGEIPNVIGDAGLIFAETDVNALRAHLQALISDRELWQALSRRGRDRVLARFTQAQVAAATVSVYHEMANDPSCAQATLEV
ncbi:MAG: glycosyltransferase family 4 protein [Anaerolineae bacterium]|nr:glycosyltransferase family 4 protein [Anaerolineae bacterium]